MSEDNGNNHGDAAAPNAADLGYTAPAEKSLDAILSADAEDDALRKYKAALLGSAVAGTGKVVVEASNPSNVIVRSLALVVNGRDDMVLDLKGLGLKEIKKKVSYMILHWRLAIVSLRDPQTFAIKEGIQFRIRIDFFVQREIVTGLKYVQKTSRMGVTGKKKVYKSLIHSRFVLCLLVDKMTHMVGSYAPKEELQSYITPWDDAPSGRTGRGTYHVTSLFTDDDKTEYLKWEWSIEIKKDW